jgi:hypothetical protein
MGGAVGIDLVHERRDGRPPRGIRVRGDRVVLGRGRGCHLRLRSRLVSRKHARFRYQDGAWFVEDLESRNGTLLNSRWVRAGRVGPGDLVMLGEGGPRFRVRAVHVLGHRASLDETRTFRFVRVDRVPVPPTVAGTPSTVPAEPFPEPGPRLATGWIGAALGLAFGLLTAWRVWDPAWFPYPVATAPAAWCHPRLAALAPERVAELGAWPGRFLLALHYGLLGYALQRPWRRLAWVLLLAGAHAAAVWATV